jgi:hypothetical protein
MMAHGMATYLGMESKPSEALFHRHVVHNQKQRMLDNEAAETPLQRYLHITTNLAEAFTWLGGIHSSETFGIAKKDAEIVWRHDHVLRDLPQDTGDVLVKLLPSTNSIQTKQD